MSDPPPPLEETIIIAPGSKDPMWMSVLAIAFLIILVLAFGG